MEEQIKQLMSDIYDLKSTKKEKEELSEKYKKEIEQIDARIDTLSQELLTEFNASNQKVFVWEEKAIVAEKFSKENIGYTSESDVLEYLKNNYASQYIKVKTTEALDKNALKKAVKTDAKLSSALDAMIIKSVTEYVVVTDIENHKRMLEHINESKS